ncbi:MAG: hypothetical protein J6V66_05235 [Clostridia bacterium]|nr:hypothetical protein [Clostridia bacterium]
MFKTILVIISIALILGGAILYIILSLKKGKKCIGCPYAQSCAKKSCATKEDK